MILLTSKFNPEIKSEFRWIVVALILNFSLIVFATPIFADTKLAFLMDGSGSISTTDWQLQKDGISNALQDGLTFPRDGSISVGIIQFSYVDSTQRTRLEIPLTVINSQAAVDSLVASVQAVNQISFLTNPGDGIRHGTDILLASGSDPISSDWVLCMSTDGTTNSGEALSTAAAYAQGNNVDKFAVIAIEDLPFADGAALRAHYEPHVFGDGSVTVARNSIEFASIINGGCLNSPIELRAMEANQSVQDWHNSVPLISDKPTTVRVFVEVPTGEDPQNVVGRLYGKKGGGDLPGSPIVANNTGSRVTADEDIVSRRANLDDSLNFILPANWLNGTIELEFDAAGTPVNCNEPNGPGSDPADDCRLTLTFQDANEPSVVFVGVSYIETGATIAPSNAELAEQQRRFESILPLASTDVSFDTYGPYASEPTLGTVISDLLTQRATDGSSAHYYGVLSGGGGGLGYRPGFSSAGYLSGSGAVGGTGYARNRGPHEYSHNLGRYHAVDDALGLDGDGNKQGQCGSTAPAAAPPHEPFETVGTNIRPTIGPLSLTVEDEIWGLDNRFVTTNTNNLAVVDPRATFAVMSYCGGGPQGRWISDYTYTAEMGSIPATASDSGISGDFYFVRGEIDMETNTISLRPILEVRGTPPTIQPGSYRAALFDSDGNEISGMDFAPIIVDADSENPETPTGPAKGLVLVPLLQPTGPIGSLVVSHNNVPMVTVTASANAPVVNIVTPAGGESFDGDNVELSWTGSDADGDPLVYSVFYSIDDGAKWKLLASELNSTSLTLARKRLKSSLNALFKVQASDGLNIGTDVSGYFSIVNNAPDVSIENPVQNESFSGLQNINLRASAFDIEDGELSGAALSWSSDKNGFLGNGSELVVNAADLAEATHQITVNATDSDGDSSTDTVAISIFRIAPVDLLGPTTSSVVVSPNPVAVDTPFTLTAVVDDTASGNANISTASYTVDSGPAETMLAQDGVFDSNVEDVTVSIPGLGVGVHEICVTGTDTFGNTGQPSCTFLVVFDPTGGFVTGGGWINSPAGAYTADPSLTGKASFGFVSKYKKGTTIPDGSTQFKFKAGGLTFTSTNYDWLVVAGYRAQFKGTGIINGGGNYGFILTAIDGDFKQGSSPDKFRIKIWEKSTGSVVYDNQIDSDYNTGPDTEIGGGSIVIHK